MNDKEWIEALQERVITLSDAVNELFNQRATLERVISDLRSENLKLEQEIKELEKCLES